MANLQLTLHNPQVIETPSQLILKETRGHGCLRVFGLFFLLPGLMVLGMALGIVPTTPPLEPGTIPWAACLFMGLIFSAVGGWIAFYTTKLVFDSNRQQVQFYGGLMFKRLSMSGESIADFPRLILRVAEISDDGAASYYYMLQLERQNGIALPVARFTEVQAALSLAKLIQQRFSHLEVVDKTMETPKVLSANDMDHQLAMKEAAPRQLAKAEIDGLRFREVVSAGSYSRLFQAEHKGGTVFKVQYPKHFVMRLIVLAGCYAFYGNFMGWDVRRQWDWFTKEIDVTNFTVETFFSSIMAGAWFLFLIVLPAIGVIKEWVKKPRQAILFVERDHLLVDDMSPQTQRGKYHIIKDVIRQDEIRGIDVKAEGKDTWKIAKRANMLVIRVPKGMIRTAHALDKSQLEVIRETIQRTMNIR